MIAGIAALPLIGRALAAGTGPVEGDFEVTHTNEEWLAILGPEAFIQANVLGTHAEVCTAGDASCLMHIGGGLSRLRAGTRTVHLAEILASTEGAVTPHQTTKPAVPA